ncbi:hypothetical protein V2J94_46925 [Streptomyces sp. DSM 41524]|uniref:Tn3 transposase DDE domain-containing protein n=1 Tax=Streptomyces asiaticus subsp. ignotus TaxID=3098222 RepID=A0ABU7QEU1_9ACTN|nr:hypothetical protein [Streptomyces sp. DSM 41524]
MKNLEIGVRARDLQVLGRLRGSAIFEEKVQQRHYAHSDQEGRTERRMLKGDVHSDAARQQQQRHALIHLTVHE